MNTLILRFTRFGLAAAAFLAFSHSARSALPEIQSVTVDSTNITVTASVGSGHAAIYLEKRDRLGAGAWVPVAVKRGDSAMGTITFEIPRTTEFGLLRVRADNTLPLPASFYSGTNSFGLDFSANEGVYAFDSMGPGSPAAGTPPGRTVVESDIWRLDGDTLYFFNQNRGLQIIDVSDPDDAAIRGVLNLPAAGDQMYLLPTNHVVLLTRSSCGGYVYGGIYPPIYGSGQSEILIVSVSNGTPKVVAELPVDGGITESRLVGTALYIASQVIRPVPDSGDTAWEWATKLTSFDLTNPSTPVARSTIWFPGYNNVVHATDAFFFATVVNPTNGFRSIVHVVDITNPNGMMHPFGEIHTAGRVEDKFKLNWDGAVFSAISEVTASPRLTKLETFSLPAPAGIPLTPSKMGEVEVGHGERLFATRFDGERAYIVTFLQIDPLWVVDLSNPEHPTISGELEVPGWSTFIHPMGDQLLAVGVETNVTTVSLFDVSDPAHPTLLSRVGLGSQYSYTEAHSDEKAFNVLEDEGLILLPVQGYYPDPQAWVQLIDLETNALTVRGMIPHDFVPRRATTHRDRILSISAAELLSVEAADRDQPTITGQLELSWPVNHVLLAGNHLLQITSGSAWNFQGDAFVIVSPTSDPSVVLDSLRLTNAPISGAELRSNRLYLAQTLSSTTLVGTNYVVSNRMWLTVVSLDNLPALSVIGETSAPVSQFVTHWGNALHAVWPASNLLVWAGGGGSFPFLIVADMITTAPAFGFRPYPLDVGDGHFFAFDVSDDAAPAFESEVNLATNGIRGFSRAFAPAENLVYVSHNGYFQPGPKGGDPIAVPWSQYYKSFLNVIDFTDASMPAVRPPVNIRGTLKGVSHAGALLYTLGSDPATTNYYDGSESVFALAYDGIAAHLVDAIPLTNAAVHTLAVDGTNVFVAGRETLSVSNAILQQLETWALDGTGNFQLIGAVGMTGHALDLVSFPGLLAAQTGFAQVEVFDRSDPASLRLVGKGPNMGCLYFNLRNGDARRGEDLWLPLDIFGVTRVPLAP